MEKNNDLYDLIHSLSKGEKAYFKKYTSMHVRGEQNNYTRLFDALEKQKKYDEKKIRHRFRNERFMKQYSVAKNYLYALLLESLESFHTSVESKLGSLINQTDILQKKRLTLQAAKLIRSGKRTAAHYQKPLHYLALVQRELLLISGKRYAGTGENELAELFNDCYTKIDSVRNLFEYWSLNAQIYYHIKLKGGYVRSEADKELFEKLLAHPLLKDNKDTQSFLAEYLYHTCLTGYYFSTNNISLMHFHCLEVITLLEKHPHLTDENPQSRIHSLLNLGIAQMGLKKYAEVPDTIQKIRAVKTGSEYMSNQVFEQANTIEMQFFITTGQFEKALALFNLVEKKFSESKKQVLFPHQMPVVFFYKAIVMFALGRTSESAKLLNMGLNEKSLYYRSDLHCFAKIFSLVVHYELGNQDLLYYITRSTYRYLLKRNRLYKFEAIVLNYIRTKMPFLNSKKELHRAFAELKGELEQLRSDPLEKNALEYFDYISWLESKIENRDFAAIVGEKALGANKLP